MSNRVWQCRLLRIYLDKKGISLDRNLFAIQGFFIFYMQKCEAEKKTEISQDDPLDSQTMGKGCVEQCLRISQCLGEGTMKAYHFKSGIHVFVNNYNIFHNVKIEHGGDCPTYGFSFWLSGTTKLDLYCLKESLVFKNRESGFFYFPSREGFFEDMPGTRIHNIVVLIDPHSLGALMEEELYNILINLKVPLRDNGSISEPFDYTDSITPSMHMILQQIIHCPYQGAGHRIFIEAKAMELIACKLDQLNPSIRKQEKTARLKSCDIDRIHYAGELLVKNLQSPPNIIELSKAIGVSRTKLYHDFNLLYGTTPTEYLRFKRIEKAKRMVQNKNLSLTQIAYSLGYSNSSHFAKAFREHFGMPPSRYRQNER
ncbi:helix-turn-helix domain-containing protein [Desulfosarcina ovata]|uniref:helix-turn-helix domain-containing protein n=1 Tax=Desulfosarcina ovata TaxID=83564 RepID=UPI001E4B6D78|nr:AraC family transcriptional regulator [Desulfosarcina ovata]